MQQCPQYKEWHAEGDVWIHTNMVVQELLLLPEYQTLDSEYAQAVLALSALLHDIAKPECTETDANGLITAPKHAVVGEHIVRRLLWDIPLGTRENICALVRLHGLPLWALNKGNPNAAVIAASFRTDNRLLYALAKADVLGRISQHRNEYLDRCEYFKELCIENHCWEQPYPFVNPHSRFKFFFKNDEYPSEWFDDTEFEITILSGIPGSGKDTYAQKIGLPMISLDQIRQELKIDATDRDGQGRVANEAYERARELCRRKKSFVWNSTNLTNELRSKIIGTLSVYNPFYRIVYLHTSWDNTLQRRSEYIPLAALEKMQRILEMPLLTEAHELLMVEG